MAYVRTDTSNPLGRRNLARLAGYPPYPQYGLSRAVARLNGEFNPAGPDPSTNPNGAITYRIDPRTGKYIFSRTDLKPRGVFTQNTFQHPTPPLMSALGIPLLPAGITGVIRRGPIPRDPRLVLNRNIRLSGLGCNCGGNCRSANTLSGPRRMYRRRLRGLGDVNECSFDSDCGPGGVCGAGVCLATGTPATTTTVNDPIFGPTPVGANTGPIAPTTIVSSPNPFQQVASGVSQIVATATKPHVVITPTTSGSLLPGVPNSYLALGGVVVAALGMESRRRR